MLCGSQTTLVILFHLISTNSNIKSQLKLPVPSYGSRFHPQLKMWKCVSVVDWFRRTYKSSLLKNLLESCSQVWGEKADAVRRGNSILDMPICLCLETGEDWIKVSLGDRNPMKW